MKFSVLVSRTIGLATMAICVVARGDMVTEWNANAVHAVQAVLTPTPPIGARAMAIVQAAVYDAANGIAQEYEPYFVTEQAPPGARPEAAVAEAAYTVLVALMPTQKPNLDAELAVSLAEIPGSQGNSVSIARGLAWGAHVANLILAWRSTDGLTTPLPPYFGGTGPGVWRSIPDGTLPGAFPQMAILTPFAIASPSQYRPGPPPALTSQQYADDVNEIKAIGGTTSTVRTDEQTQVAKLWAAVAAPEENAAVVGLLPATNSLADNARVLALANIVLTDCLIASFDSKYTYVLWRPFHAIRLADTDGNPLTDPDPTWTPLVTTPRFPEYVSNHAILTAGFMRTMADLLGDEHTFVLSSPAYPSFTITYNRFSDAAEEVKFARMWGGLHFRNSCNVGQAMGVEIADYVVGNFLRPLGGGNEDGQ
jgi:hypothetical protein